ncbi:MAG: efflux RND transporter permease subunit, partial [Terriglobales bacterium]
PVFTVMLIAFLVTLGVFSYRGLAVDLFPKADPATINVEVALPGATPDEMVTGVVLPLEDAISSVSGIDEISVYATEGKADIIGGNRIQTELTDSSAIAVATTTSDEQTSLKINLVK